MEEDLIKKAVLILGGGILLPIGFQIPCRVSNSTAGPDAGFKSLVLSFGGYRVKKNISYISGEFELHVSKNGTMYLTHNGDPFIQEVLIEPIIYHCPEQAFFNIDPRCIFKCRFCASPLIGTNNKHLTVKSVIEMLNKSMTIQKIKAVSLTSGVVGSIDETTHELLKFVKAIRNEYTTIPIGVELYTLSHEHIQSLKYAGANEIKLNIETSDESIFSKVCPDLDMKSIMSNLEYAVKIFGRGKVTSNIIYGLGESDESIRSLLIKLCSIGVIPNLRALRINSINHEAIRIALGYIPKVTTDRMIKLARMHKDIMKKYKLTSVTSYTMCMECKCCDIVPFKDI